LSLILAIAMVMSLLPTFAITAGAADTVELKYIFNQTAGGATGKTALSLVTYDTITQGNKWQYASYYKMASQALDAGGMRFVPTSGYATEKNNGMAIKIDVPEGVSGTFLPTVTCAQMESGGIMNVYLISAEDATAKGWDMHASSSSYKTSAVYQVIANSAQTNPVSTKIIDGIDTYNGDVSQAIADKDYSATVTKTGDTIELSTGTYYLVFAIVGANANAKVYSDTVNSYYARICNISFRQAGDAEVTVTAAKKEIAIGEKTTVSASIKDGFGNPVSADVSYESSNNSIATVDANGKVEAIAEGKVTITATATVGGAPVSGTVDIEVVSTAPRDEHYYFCYQALNGVTNTLGLSENNNAKDTYTYDDINTTISPSKWDYLMARNTLGVTLRSGVASVPVRTDYKDGENVAAFTIKVNGAATYIPSVAFLAYQSGAKFSTYLAEKSLIDTKYGWNVSDKTGGLASALNAIKEGNSDIIRLGTSDTYSTATSVNANSYTTDTFAPVSLNSGEYYLFFVMDGANENAVEISGTYKHLYYWIKNVKLTLLSDVTLSLSAESDVVEIGGETSVYATLRDASGADVKGVDISFESSNKDVATVDNKGNVTAKAVGKTTITASATVAGVPLSDSVEIEVEAEDLGNAGVSLEYFFDTRVMSAEARAAALEAGKADKNLGLDSSGNLRHMSFISKLSDIDATKSAQYAWPGMDSYDAQGFVLTTGGFNITATKGYYSDSRRQFFVLKVNIPNKGIYNFAVRATLADFGTGADVHLIPAKGVTEITREMLDARTPVGHFETKGSGDSGYMKVGKFNAEKRGEYYVVFDFITDNPVTYNNKGKHYFYGQAMKIAAAPGDFDKVEMTLRGIEEGDPIALKSVRDINIVLTDKAGMPLDEIDESKLNIEITSSKPDVAVITEGGKLDTVSCGEATITAKVTYDNVTREKSVSIVVAPMGKELLGEAQNPDIESDVWPWDMARQDEEPTSPWWIRSVVGTVEKDGDANNRAMGVVINPEIAASDVYGFNASNGKYNNPPGPAYIRAADGPRVKAKTGQFYLFTFKMKLENWTTPAGASPMAMNIDLYPYSGPNASSSTPGYNRGMNIVLEPNWMEKYQEWQTVTIPVSAEFLTGRDVEYFTPVFVFRPSQTDIMKAGYGGTAWFDDFSLREVGFDDLEVTVDGELSLGENYNITINVRPRTASGQYISLDASCVPGCVEIDKDNDYIIGEIMKPERTAMTGMPGIYYASAVSSLAGMNGTANISA
ncbi:MAG: Ig-like domain-containing protein, partial [Oscillospiraceae bacterium]|nr:Ig-like domain-containing protein [Oscillospiraceae bacterium]